MNGYSQEVRGWANDRLLREHKRLSETARYSDPAADSHWQYRAVLEELQRRGIDPAQTITTSQGVEIPCDSAGRPFQDEPERYIRRW